MDQLTNSISSIILLDEFNKLPKLNSDTLGFEESRHSDYLGSHLLLNHLEFTVISQTQRCMPLFLGLGRLRQEDCQFDTS